MSAKKGHLTLSGSRMTLSSLHPGVEATAQSTAKAGACSVPTDRLITCAEEVGDTHQLVKTGLELHHMCHPVLHIHEPLSRRLQCSIPSLGTSGWRQGQTA